VGTTVYVLPCESIMRRVIAFQDLARWSVSHFVLPTHRRRVTATLTRIRAGVSTHELLRQLRGRVIDAAGESWRVEVYSIVDDSNHRWIQLGLAGREERTMLMKLPYLADADDAIGSIEQWVCDSSCQHAVLTVPAGD
jgi:hypothetical protein